MKTIVDNNTMKSSDLEVSGVGIIPEVAVVKEVRISNIMDADGKRTDAVDCIKYVCVNPDNFSSFVLKVNATRPIVTNEAIENSEKPIFVSIPVSEVVIRPYEIAYGRAKVTISSPFVKLMDE